MTEATWDLNCITRLYSVWAGTVSPNSAPPVRTMSRRASGTSRVAKELAVCRVSLLRSMPASRISHSACWLKAARPLRTSSLPSTA
ncbi:hypothetical protein D9M71_656020 [compost metagenome]